jgi:hypothetical protein
VLFWKFTLPVSCAYGRGIILCALRAPVCVDSRLPVGAVNLFNFRDEFVKNRNLTAWNFYNPDDISQQVDVVITYDLRGRRRHRVHTASGPLFLLTLEELVNMKKASGRPQDLADVEALEKLR